ncbi:hypothetical protein FLACOL_01959 [Flavobacterium columnare]|uniref:Uncharacterized protein n=2 Tax=Flavobacterium TaxID=237 RepID=A0ABW8PSR5_9FLAO|nr:hypothetical protein [Flavobacterium columnare]SPE77945.1 hypothetical protein FLACOL_01959 [Flavobacterium columnare]
MSKITYVGGDYLEWTGGDYKMYAKGDITYNSNKAISITSDVGISFGEPKSPPKREIVESEWKLESTYIHDHIKSVATEMVAKFNGDNTGIVYKLYKDIADGKVVNPPIVVTKSLHSGLASYDEDEKKILIWETSLLMIEKFNDRKIKLIASLAEAYGKYINHTLEDLKNSGDNYETYDYDLFRFDAPSDTNVTIAKLESPSYSGNLDIFFPKQEQEEPQHFRQNRHSKGGPNPTDYENTNSGSGDPHFNMGLKFSFSLGGGFTTSLYAGISKNISSGDFHLMPSFNAALTYYGNGAPGTSPMSKHLVTLSGTPAVTLGYKTGNALNMNLFNNFTGSGVNNPFEYAFTLGSTGVLSTGKVTSNFKKMGEREKDEHNSQDNPHRHQIIGGASIKVGNFMISSYNDIYKPPLFLGMNSDQYWSAGVNIQAKLTDKISMAYAFDLYYGKSNNKMPFNLDKYIDGQNYDYQRLFDVLLNRGQETFSFTDANGGLNQSTKFGYGTFWPSNNMHNAIPFPEKPIEPKKPIESEYTSKEKLKEAKAKYEKELIKYENDMFNFNMSTSQLENSPTKHRPLIEDKTTAQYYKARTFHHLFVVYKEDNKIDYERLFKYLQADIPQKETQEFYKLGKNNKKSNGQ